MTDITVASIKRHFGGRITGRNRISIPTPGHSSRDLGTSIEVNPSAPGGLIVNCFNDGDPLAIKDAIRAAHDLEAFRPSERRELRPALPRPVEPDADEIERTRRALTLWGEGQPIAGTPGAAYLAARGVPYEGEELKWHARCPFGEGERHPCMIALLRDVRTDEPRGVHRTAFGPDGAKLSRKVFGPARGAAVKLFPGSDMGLAVLGLAEGIETSLSIRRLRGLDDVPVWAAVNAGGIAAFPILPGLERIWVAVDRDPVGEKACRALADRAVAAGVEAFLIRPRAAGADLNDLRGVRGDA